MQATDRVLTVLGTSMNHEQIDAIYGARIAEFCGTREGYAVQRLERPFLHAWRLAFTHPTDGRRLEFESPLPADLQTVLDTIREKQSDSDGSANSE